MKKVSIPLSPSETEVLRIVWELENATVQDVCTALPKSRDIAYATVQTLLRRLEKKGYVKHRTQGKAHVFYPVAKQDDVIGSAVGSFIDKLFGGDAVPLVQYLARHGQLTSDDVSDLKKMVAEKEDGGEK
jgi:BlaI family penicillinase repressor